MCMPQTRLPCSILLVSFSLGVHFSLEKRERAMAIQVFGDLLVKRPKLCTNYTDPSYYESVLFWQEQIGTYRAGRLQANGKLPQQVMVCSWGEN